MTERRAIQIIALCVSILVSTACNRSFTFIHLSDPQQFGWLEAQLRASEGRKGIVVFFHHPVIRKDMDEPEEYFNLPVPRRERYIGLFKKYGVKAVLTGHAHIPSMTVCDGIAFCTAGAVGSPLGGSRSGYAVVKISGRKLSWTFVPTEILLN